MKYKYRRIELNTEKDFKIAEDLKNKNWKIVDIGFNSILLEKKGE